MKVEKNIEGPQCTVTITGAMTDTSDFSELRFEGVDSVVFDLEGVRHINSSGIVLWVRMLRQIPKNVEIALSRCSLVIFHQLRVFPMFLDGNRVKVRSFMVEYECQPCAAELPILIEATEAGPEGSLPTKKCPKCAGSISPCSYVPGTIGFLKKTSA